MDDVPFGSKGVSLGRFKKFVFCEQTKYIAEELGDLLESLQGINEQADSLGKRHLFRLITKWCNRARLMIKGNWSNEEERFLYPLQTVAYNLLKALDDSGDIKPRLASAVALLQKTVESTGQPINNLAAPATGEEAI